MSLVYAGSNFAKKRNTYMQIVIGTEDEPVTLRILPPTVGILRGIQEAARFIQAKYNEEETDLTYEEALDYSAAAMCNNIDGVAVTSKTLENMGFSIMDISEFISEYTEFLFRLADGKN